MSLPRQAKNDGARRYFVELKDASPQSLPIDSSPIPYTMDYSRMVPTATMMPGIISSEGDGGLFLRSESPAPLAPSSIPEKAQSTSKPVINGTSQLISIELEGGDYVEYEPHNLIGNGRYSRVYRGKLTKPRMEPSFTNKVAIKVFFSDEDSWEAARNEVAILSELENTPGVIQQITNNLNGPNPIIILELLFGDLTDRIEMGQNQTILILDLMSSLAQTLKQIHTRGIVHLDVKPENILFTRLGNPFLSDFGSAMNLNAARSEKNLLPGTLIYTAPELLSRNDEYQVSPAADIYSWGAVLYTLLSNRRPFNGGEGLSGTALILAIKRGFMSYHCDDTIVARDELRMALWQLMIECTDRDPGKRPTASQIVTRLTVHGKR